MGNPCVGQWKNGNYYKGVGPPYDFWSILYRSPPSFVGKSRRRGGGLSVEILIKNHKGTPWMISIFFIVQHKGPPLQISTFICTGITCNNLSMKINTRGSLVLDGEKLRIYTRGDHCVSLYNKIKFYKGVPLCFTFATTWEFIQGSTIMFLKNIMSKILKNKWGLSAGNSSDSK